MTPRKPRIIVLVTQDDLGGAGRYALTLAEGFRDRAAISLAVGADGDGWLSHEAATLGIPVIRLASLRRSIRPLDDIRALIGLRRELTRGRYDVLHANSTKAGLIASLAAATLRRPRRPRVVYTVHGWAFLEPLPLFTKTLYRFSERVAASFRDATIVLSEREEASAVALGIPKRTITRIPHAVTRRGAPLGRAEASGLLGLLGLSGAKTTIIGTIANLYPAKGIDVLLQAVARPELRDVPFRLVVVGDGPERASLERAISGHPRKGDIALTGSVPDAWRILPAFDIFVLPSRKEGLPYALLEAIAAGLPIVATDVGGVREALAGAGCVVAPEDPGALATELATLLHDKNLRGRSAEASIARARSLPTRERMLELTWRAYTTR